ncbi:hypothetical protein SAMN05216525_106154 [Bradyrhizobium sp. Gha]|nr:hypothetical protein SAMN05216525_106154 [Bradyrhizobium sp. Gha]
MPLLAYFWKVGAALLALLFVADFCLRAPVAWKTRVDGPAIRIYSDRKWPERVVLDTSSPATVAATPEIMPMEKSPPADGTKPPVIGTELPAVVNALAMARTDQQPRETVDRKRARKTRHIASRSRRQPPQMALATRQAQYAWFGYRYW